MLSRFEDARARPDVPIPAKGVIIVFRHQMRARCPVRDLIWASVILLSHAALAVAFQSSVMPLSEYASDSPRFVLRLLTMAALVGPLLYMPISAVLGSFAAPPISRFEETQAMLLTRLSPFDVCAGRLLASLWPVISAILGSFALSLAAQLSRRTTPDGYTNVLMVHLVLLTSAIAVGAAGQLAAMRIRPGRVLARGIGIATGLAVFSVSGLFLANSTIQRMEDPTRLIYAVLLINPAVAATTALQADVLRIPSIYARTDAHDYPFLYPPPAASCAVFAGCGAVALALSSLWLRRAYR